MNETRIEIEEIPADHRQIAIEGRTLFRGQRLSSLLDEFGGFEGEVVQPTTGRRFVVSLEPWRDRDPNATWLEISFIADRD